MVKRQRYVNRGLAEEQHNLFNTAEEAWFWFARCQRLRGDNAKNDKNSSPLSRPCEPDDIYRETLRLHRTHIIHSRHLQVLAKYGLAGCPPDSRLSDEKTALILWREALDALSVPLRKKKIVIID